MMDKIENDGELHWMIELKKKEKEMGMCMKGR